MAPPQRIHPPKGIIFDRGGVLVWHNSIMSRNPTQMLSEELEARYGVGAKWWREAMKLYNDGYDIGMLSARERMLLILQYVDLEKYTNISDLIELETFYESRAALLSPQIGVLAKIQAAGIPFGLCSNASPREAAVDGRIGLLAHISGAGYSYNMRVKKPSLEAYTKACALIGLTPSDCWFVDDGADGSLQGGRAAGLTVVYYHHPDGYGFEHPEAVKGAWDIQIEHLNELLTLLEIA